MVLKCFRNEFCRLQDLAHAANNEEIAVQRTVAGIFLELAFSADVLIHMASMNTPGES